MSLRVSPGGAWAELALEAHEFRKPPRAAIHEVNVPYEIDPTLSRWERARNTGAPRNTPSRREMTRIPLPLQGRGEGRSGRAFAERERSANAASGR